MQQKHWQQFFANNVLKSRAELPLVAYMPGGARSGDVDGDVS
jgi:hypothetical protein